MRSKRRDRKKKPRQNRRRVRRRSIALYSVRCLFVRWQRSRRCWRNIEKSITSSRNAKSRNRCDGWVVTLLRRLDFCWLGVQELKKKEMEDLE